MSEELSKMPTEVMNKQWIYVHNPNVVDEKKRKIVEEDKYDDDLAMFIVMKNFEFNKDRTKALINTWDGTLKIPLTVEDLDKLAKKSGIISGKWMIYSSEENVNETWKVITRAVLEGKLGPSAKVSTKLQAKEKKINQYAICVYTLNYFDIKDVKRVRKELKKLEFKRSLCYKSDLYTYLDIYYKTTPLSPCRYRE